ncbi:MAG: NAD(+)/NADH kinase [Brevinematales bacterium]|jgi:NAD+ kinase
MAVLKKVLIVANTGKNKVRPILNNLQALLKSKNIESNITTPIHFKLKNGNMLTDLDPGFKFTNYDIIIALGGDGTFLFTARTFHQFRLPILGINAGRVGFLMEVKPAEVEKALDRIIRDEVNIYNRILIEVSVIRKGRKIFICPFLNDAVVSKGVLSRMVELSACFGGEMLSRYRSDGLIVSTPTGSTAYNLAAGGPILTQDLEAMIISPICPHILGVRPIVTTVNKELSIVLTSGEHDTTLTIDGQENFYLSIGDILRFRKIHDGVCVYDPGEVEYFSILREKLGWHK